MVALFIYLRTFERHWISKIWLLCQSQCAEIFFCPRIQNYFFKTIKLPTFPFKTNYSRFLNAFIPIWSIWITVLRAQFPNGFHSNLVSKRKNCAQTLNLYFKCNRKQSKGENKSKSNDWAWKIYEMNNTTITFKMIPLKSLKIFF